MRNPLDAMKIRSNLSIDAYSREKSELHNIYGRNIRIDSHTGKKRNHFGWDLLAKDGTPVRAVASGTVVNLRREPSSKTDYGNLIEIEFINDGITYTAFYGHLKTVLVALFAKVSEGQIIGTTGHTGNAYDLPISQRHLHFEIRTKNGSGSHGAVDPARILKDSGVLTCHI